MFGFRAVKKTPLSIGFVLILVAAACNQTPSAPSGPTGPISVGMFAPYSGPDAAFGDLFTAGCVSATYLINNAGGVLGHNLNCVPVDSRGDPADAVPAMRQMLATTPNLELMMGLTSDEASATVPMVEAAKITLLDGSGQTDFNRNTNPYYWRMYAADDTAGYAMAAWAKQAGYTTGVALFGNDIGSQGTVPTLTSGFKKAGGSISLNLSVALDQVSYRSEVDQVIAANPQVIFMEVDPQTAATFLHELKQVHALYPIIGADPELLPEWFHAVAGAIGGDSLSQNFVGENPSATSSGPAWDIYNGAIFAAPGVPSPKDHATDAYTEIFYDGTNIAALAMLEANSVLPTVYNSFILKVTKPSAGAVIVNSYAAGKQALAAGKQIQYIGVTGVVDFNQWHNSSGTFDIDKFSPTGAQITIGQVTAQQISALVG